MQEPKAMRTESGQLLRRVLSRSFLSGREIDAYLAAFTLACFFRSAHRRFIASAILFLPSGVSLRFLGAETAFALTGPRF